MNYSLKTDFYYCNANDPNSHHSDPRPGEVFVLLNGEFVSGCQRADVYAGKVNRIKNDLSKESYRILVTDYGTFSWNCLSMDYDNNWNLISEEIEGDVQILFINQECRDQWLSRQNDYYKSLLERVENGQGTQSG